MWQLFIGSLMLSLIHAAIPNHWVPLVAIGKAEKWTLKESLSATIITGFAHTLSTVIIGIIVGFIGFRLANSYAGLMNYFAPSVLVIIGLMYFVLDLKAVKHHHHVHNENKDRSGEARTKTGILIGLSSAMFFTPCVEIEAYYFRAGMIGWTGIFIVSAVYTLATVLLMLVLVYAGYKGMQRIRSHMLEHHEKSFTGIVLILLGILAFFVKF
jgi:putative Mn2+ efflux pump MntP